MKQVTLIEDNLSDFLLRDIIFFIDDKKPIKKGKLILFKFKEFHFSFTIKNHKDEHRVYEIPYPYKWEREDNSITFSYNVEDLFPNGSDSQLRAKFLDTSSCDKLYNSYLVLSAL